MKKFAFLIASLLLAGSASAQAVKPTTGFYVGAEGGLANTKLGSSAPRAASQSSNVAVLRAAIGYQVDANWALEAGYFGTGDFRASERVGLVTYERSVTAKGGDLAAVYKFTEGVPGLYLKAGMTYASLSGSSLMRAGNGVVTRSSSSQSGTGYLFGVGYEFDVGRNVGVNVGYTRQMRLGGESGNNTNLFTVGAKYRF